MPIREEIDKNIISEYSRLCELLSETWAIGLCLIALPESAILYTSKNYTAITGLNEVDFQDNQKEVMKQTIHPNDYPLLLKVHAQAKKMFRKLYQKHSNDHLIFSQYNVRMKCADGNFQPMTVIIKPVFYNRYGSPRLAYLACYPEKKMGYYRFSLRHINKGLLLYYTSTSNKFVEPDTASLRKIESDILQFTSKGMSEIRIARELGIKLDLVRYYKKSIYKRFFTSSMNEAVYIAMKSGLI